MERFRPISGEQWPGPPFLPVDSAGGLEVGCSVAADDRMGCLNSMGRCLTSAVGVGATALGHAHHQLTLARAARFEHGHLDGLAFCLECGSDVEQILSGAGHVVVFCMWLLYHVWLRRQPQASSSSISSISAVSIRPSIQRVPSGVIWPKLYSSAGMRAS